MVVIVVLAECMESSGLAPLAVVGMQLPEKDITMITIKFKLYNEIVYLIFPSLLLLEYKQP